MNRPTPFAFATRSRFYVVAAFAATLLAACSSPTKPPTIVPLGYGYKDAEAELDHFLCYTIDDKESDKFDPGKKHKGGTVSVNDQFHKEFVAAPVSHRELLCNPTLKTHGRDNKHDKYVHEHAHLVCYRTTSFGGHLVRIFNQFEPSGSDPGELTSELLCLPTGKSKDLEQAPSPPPPEDLSHFLCYKDAKPYPLKGADAKLADQFIAKKAQFDLKTRELLCNPADKIVKIPDEPDKRYPKQHDQAHLVCYTIDPAVKELPTAFKVRINNQFEDARIQTDKAKYLCVPSAKKDLQKLSERE